jgi:Zn-dependent protease with chaperone function
MRPNLIRLTALAALGTAAALVARRSSPSRESLLPVLRAGEEQGLQAERLAAQALPVDADDERRLGEELRERRGPDTPVRRDLERLGRRLERTGLVPRYAGRYDYEVSPTPAVNAYSLPGGFIVVTQGLLDRLGGDPARVSFVLGHELAHAQLGHTTNLIRYKAWLEAFDVPGADLVQLLRQIPAQAYGRTQELEADTLALTLLRRADLRAEAAAETLAALEPPAPDDGGLHRDPGGVLTEALGDYFHSHPGRQERLDNIRDRIGHSAPVPDRGL